MKAKDYFKEWYEDKDEYEAVSNLRNDCEECAFEDISEIVIGKCKHIKDCKGIIFKKKEIEKSTNEKNSTVTEIKFEKKEKELERIINTPIGKLKKKEADDLKNMLLGTKFENNAGKIPTMKINKSAACGPTEEMILETSKSIDNIKIENRFVKSGTENKNPSDYATHESINGCEECCFNGVEYNCDKFIINCSGVIFIKVIREVKIEVKPKEHKISSNYFNKKRTIPVIELIKRIGKKKINKDIGFGQAKNTEEVDGLIKALQAGSDKKTEGLIPETLELPRLTPLERMNLYGKILGKLKSYEVFIEGRFEPIVFDGHYLGHKHPGNKKKSKNWHYYLTISGEIKHFRKEKITDLSEKKYIKKY